MGTYQKDNQVPGCVSKSQEIGYSTTRYLRKENIHFRTSHNLVFNIITLNNQTFILLCAHRPHYLFVVVNDNYITTTFSS
ncbi:hypothetical protein JHK82_016273 [Glycine max]|nr:hypothetical protein JHK85_016681 [Glycine max]KAG5149392.1 hypothetical protein JHK82_016273 [Glycine max]